MNLFNFEHPIFLWALLLAPALWLVARFWVRPRRERSLAAFADPELLPHLVRGYGKANRASAFLALWAAVWCLGVLALAGPRWSFTEVPSYKPQKDLVVALDLSKSMDNADVRPTRLERAKEKIADLLNENPDLRIGLIAFAGDAHMITPLTEDRATLLHLLPALDTDLVVKPGRNFTSAGALANSMLKGDAGAKALLIITDQPTSTKLSGVKVSVFNAANPQETVPGQASLFGLSSWSGHSAESGVAGKDWDPRFYVFLIPAMLVFLSFFRRREASQAVVAALAVLAFAPSPRAHADTIGDAFRNREMQGQAALKERDFKRAAEKFTDAYRRGVAEYRAGDYAAAARSFAQSKRPQVATDAHYNLGNALAQSGHYEEAVSAYKQALKERPEFADAKKNLKIVEDLLNKRPPPQQQQPQNQASQPNSKDQNGKNGGSKSSQAQAAKDSSGKAQSPKENGSQGEPKQANGGANKNSKQASSADKNSIEQKQESRSAQGAGEKEAKSQASKNAAARGEGDKRETAKNEPSPNGGVGEKPAPERSAKANQGAEAGAKDAGPDKQKEARKYARDVDSDQWLNLVRNDPHQFLKNQFLIESARAEGGQEDVK